VLDEIAAELAGIVKIARINAATEPELMRRFDVRGVPSFYLYRGGSIVKEFAGAMPKAQLLQWIRSSV
jgi:thioredoxin 1